MKPEKGLQVALITGATGFIGSHLARRLVKDGWEVHVILRPESDLAILQGAAKQLIVHRHDGTTGSMLEIVAAAKPEIVFHLASLFLAQHRSDDIEPLVTSNITFGTQLVEAMVAKGCYRLVNTGTSWQHYENDEYNPVNLYAATKQAFEDILRYYVETSPLMVITLKLFDTYGPEDLRPKLFALLRKVLETQETLAMSPGEQLIDLVYIDDVIEAFIVAAERVLSDKGAAQEDFAVTSGAPIRLKELVNEVARTCGRPIPINWGGRPYRPREVMVPWTIGAVLPGWRPSVGFKEGVDRVFSSVLAVE